MSNRRNEALQEILITPQTGQQRVKETKKDSAPKYFMTLRLKGFWEWGTGVILWVQRLSNGHECPFWKNSGDGPW